MKEIERKRYDLNEMLFDTKVYAYIKVEGNLLGIDTNGFFWGDSEHSIPAEL